MFYVCYVYITALCAINCYSELHLWYEPGGLTTQHVHYKSHLLLLTHLKYLDLQHSLPEFKSVPMFKEKLLKRKLNVISSLLCVWPDTWTEKPAFGTGLDEHLKRSSREIALPIEACVMMLLETGMKEEVGRTFEAVQSQMDNSTLNSTLF